jgi:Uma2 family endonuclease
MAQENRVHGKAEYYYTTEDFYNLKDDNKYELSDGVIYAMSSPGRMHQEISFEIGGQIRNYLMGKPCRGYADFNVQLFENQDKIYRPDLFIVCDKNKITDRAVIGAPDFIIEIYSESTSGVDMLEKRRMYEKAGVKEYWIIDYIDYIYTYMLNSEGFFEEKVYRGEKLSIPVQTFPDLILDFASFC